MKPPRKRSARTIKRAQSRDDEKLVRELERLALLSPGGAPERAIALGSASQVETRAQSEPCPVCGAALRVLEHTAEEHGGRRVRAVRLRCTTCGRERVRYYQLTLPS